MAQIVDSYSESNSDTETNYTDYHGYLFGQSFTGDGGTLNSIKAYLKRSGAFANNIYIYVFAHSGTYGTSSVPTGSVLATSDAVNSSTINTSLGLVTFNFSGANKITLTNGIYYTFYVLIDSGGSFATNIVYGGSDSSSPSHSGNLFYDGGGGYVASSGEDLCFYVYKDDSPNYLGKQW